MGIIYGMLLLGCAITVMSHGNHGHHDHSKKVDQTKTPSDGKENTAFQNADIVRDADHIKEHLRENINQNTINKMSPEELQFQFFVSHDLDKDGQLDGLEIFKSLTHAIDHMPDADHLRNDTDAATMRVVEMTDEVLFRQDVNFDGCLDYMEFMIGHQQPPAQPNNKPQQNQQVASTNVPQIHGRQKHEM